MGDAGVSTALVVVASPRPTSFAHAMAERATRTLRRHGVECRVHDLYAEDFRPVAGPEETFTAGLDAEAAIAASGDELVRRHRRTLSDADHLVVAHPNWWGKPPAIMAGWIDRVVVPGVAYRLAERDGLPQPLLQLRSVLVLNTGDTAPTRERDVFGDPLELIWRRCVGSYLGDVRVERVLAGPLGDSTPEQRDSWLQDVERAAVAWT